MAVKLTVILMNTRGPWHWCCQHLAAIATDIETGRTLHIEFGGSLPGAYFYRRIKKQPKNPKTPCYIYNKNTKELTYITQDGDKKVLPLKEHDMFYKNMQETFEWRNMTNSHSNTSLIKGIYVDYHTLEKLITPYTGIEIPGKPFAVYSNTKNNPLGKYADRPDCCTGVVDLFSNFDFDSFVNNMQAEFSNPYQYDCLGKNCAFAVNFTINMLCPEKVCTDVMFFIYQTLCCPIFCGTFALSCFPAPPCLDTPQDVYDKARWLAKYTSYGKRIHAPVDELKPSISQTCLEVKAEAKVVKALQEELTATKQALEQATAQLQQLQRTSSDDHSRSDSFVELTDYQPAPGDTKTPLLGRRP